MPDDHIELFLKWTPKAIPHVVHDWLERQGFSVMKMKTGLLVSGTRNQIERAFSVSLENVKPPMELPVPVEETRWLPTTKNPLTRCVEATSRQRFGKNASQKGPFYATTFSRPFKDQSGAWRNGTSFGLHDLEALMNVALEAKEVIAAHVLRR
jgi:hypothetical protein